MAILLSVEGLIERWCGGDQFYILDFTISNWSISAMLRNQGTSWCPLSFNRHGQSDVLHLAFVFHDSHAPNTHTLVSIAPLVVKISTVNLVKNSFFEQYLLGREQPRQDSSGNRYF